MLPLQSGIIDITRYATIGLALSLAGCMAAAPREESDTQGEVVALGIGTGPGCSADADCRMVPDYCADCSCLALGAQQQLPECYGEQLSCVLNPCADHVARCIEGHCSTESGDLR